MMRSSITIILSFFLAGQVASAAFLATDHAVFAPKKGKYKKKFPGRGLFAEISLFAKIFYSAIILHVKIHI